MMRITKILLPIAMLIPAIGAQSQDLRGGAHASASCAQFMAPAKAINGQQVGQEECLMIDYGIVEPTKKYHRVDIGLSGTLSGYVVKDGARQNYFTSGPD